ncbi:hypothetical protein ACRE_043090 [Hapsidospora chrysogenum ATCC 11550]|uniref:T6SS Phospholipase effector Tle1-like catalytic domain-containing protein n=1 Tax=Hapsidospora chrysogenum (strain ATCC 11550 / CBS 779.69 / DSM 880 / IAM 14645 / JCM 23072 / IMI 49137) TaxID=857340 RepID=A0A086T682_HAPC1|nr:hypothetical protein ACRE_043090 [Hapsidospora chrysogenum ATCC 11550]
MAHEIQHGLSEDQLKAGLREQATQLGSLGSELRDGSHRTAENFMRAMTEDFEKKRLFVCCDGTWNNAAGTAAPLTNVAKLARCVYRLGDDCHGIPAPGTLVRHGIPSDAARYGFVRQIVYYSSGVGSTSALRTDSWLSGATGQGVDDNILSAYNFLCNNFNGGSCMDEIILVGFSRGAFTVRCLAHFIGKVGLLRRKGLVFLNTVYRSWKRWAGGRGGEMAEKELNGLLSGLDDLRMPDVRVKVLAEWDCVSAMRSLWFWEKDGDLGFVDDNDKVPGCVDNAFHAVALHEKRWSFRPLLWNKDQATNMEQCAFAGCHSDVGGSNRDVGLSMLSLLWMISRIDGACDAVFDQSALLQFVAPVSMDPSSTWGRRSRATLGLYNQVCVPGLVQESRTGAWLLSYGLSIGRLDGNRDLLLESCAEVQPESTQAQGGNQQGGGNQQRRNGTAPGLKIHFSVRLLRDWRYRRGQQDQQDQQDPGLRCGLFDVFTPRKAEGGGGRWRWEASEPARWLWEHKPSTKSYEEYLLARWIDLARTASQETASQDESRQPATEEDGVDWGCLVDRLKELGWHEKMQRYQLEGSLIELLAGDVLGSRSPAEVMASVQFI